METAIINGVLYRWYTNVGLPEIGAVELALFTDMVKQIKLNLIEGKKLFYLTEI